MQLWILAALLGAAPARAANGDGHTWVTWYGHATFSIRTPKGTLLVLDPWFSNPKAVDKDALAKLGKVDFVLVTHGHSDHTADAVAVGKTGAKLVATFELGHALVAAGFPEAQAGMETIANTGGTLDLTDEIKVTFVPAVHSSGFNPPGQPGVTVPGGNPVGYVIQIRGGPTIYDTGDTDAFFDMKDRIGDRFKIDVMLACIGGHFTMEPEGAALAASYVRPRIMVPMHYGTFPILTGTPEELERALKARRVKTELVVMRVGKPRSF